MAVLGRARATTGYCNRPTTPLAKLTQAQAKRWLDYNRRFFSVGGYREVQPAVTASTNNDRIVVMPGVYTTTPTATT